MQHKMRENPLAPEGVNRLLERAMVGRVSTNGSDGYPYTVAVHFVYLFLFRLMNYVSMKKS